MILQIFFFCFIQYLFCVQAFAQVYYKDLADKVIVAEEKIEKETEVDCENSKSKGCKGTSTPLKFTAFGECKSISTNNGRGIFIPARSKTEWRGFMTWAGKNADIITMDSCANPEWSPWSQCSNTCGQGTKERKCNRPPLKDGKMGCKGNVTTECFDYSACQCGKLESKATFCEGQNKSFTSEPPEVTYVNANQCDRHTKCQAQCPQGFKALADATGCGL